MVCASTLDTRPFFQSTDAVRNIVGRLEIQIEVIKKPTWTRGETNIARIIAKESYSNNHATTNRCYCIS